jgi:uncharacterized protein (TIGR02145 family)
MNKNLILLFISITLSTSFLHSCKKEGCIDEVATNYDQKAKKDDGSCTYAPPSNPIYSNVTDAEGNVYPTIKVGQYEWMAANLNTAVFCNGDTIPTIISSAAGYANYLNGSVSGKFGKYYNHNAVLDERNICPCDWHVPTQEEWDYLINYYGGPEVAGGKLKQTGFINWAQPNRGATNDSNFSGIAAGFRDYEGYFQSMNQMGMWWSSTAPEAPLYSGSYNFLYYNNASVSTVVMSGGAAMSIRCVKD